MMKMQFFSSRIRTQEQFLIKIVTQHFIITLIMSELISLHSLCKIQMSDSMVYRDEMMHSLSDCEVGVMTIAPHSAPLTNNWY